MMLQIIEGDNLQITRSMPNEYVNLVYIDPPFGTGKVFKSHNGEFSDEIKGADFIEWLRLRVEESFRVLTKDGSFFLHMDYREIHYAKVMCDNIFGRDHFMNEIIWAYDYGARSKKRWPAKHDNILWYVKDPNNYTYNYDAMDRLPYMAPSLVGKEKAERGKTPTDVWWMTIVPTMSKERVGYPTQKPLKLVERIIKIHTREGDVVLDSFAGSGTTGEAALRNNRSAILIDQNPDAIKIMSNRLEQYKNKEVIFA